MSLYRNSAWFLKGVNEFTKNAFLSASKRFVEKDLEVSMAGRSFMITGANSGIGRASAMAIAKKGGTVHMVCRNKDKAEEARADIVKESGNKEIFVHILDLSETKKVWEFAETFKRKYKSLNVLINNAGCIMSQREENTEGLEMSFASNVLGVYILTKSLIALLEKSAEPRVITVSSGGMLVQKLRTGNLQSDRGRYDGAMVYAQNKVRYVLTFRQNKVMEELTFRQNKRQQVVMTEQLAKSHPNIHFSVMHPGWVDTPGVANAMPEFHSSMKESLRTPEQGADTTVWLAVSDAAATMPNGHFYQDRKMVSTHLPLAWTHSSLLEEQKFMSSLEDLAKTHQAH
ncbi:Dehydrogenase/reductase SDR family member 12 [Merluccius polli]|uniref:Dehydrogenase/reductase SDR family member 12 n=1 Tax=Merluccius polli TaxID=89951 RepID=A0AA47M690_MERPO|nr:Dehydrogenase/reductase SDR family member 12 [Merluccius polli]